MIKNMILPIMNNKLHTYLHLFRPKLIYLNSLTEKTEMLKELKKISGIYLWYNNTTQNYYVGSAKDLSNRLARYYRSSELTRIYGSLIHRALLTHGHDKFTIYILETCNPEDLIIREQFYFDLLLPIYNVLKFAASTQGRMHSERTKNKISQMKLQDPKLIDRIIALAEINKGAKRSEEFKLLRSLLIEGSNNINYGKGNTIEEFDSLNNILIIYSSVTNAAKAHNTSRSTIRYCIKNGTAYKLRYYFQYIK
jgi:group I intron endonuclease